jgi:hypothetical protein
MTWIPVATILITPNWQFTPPIDPSLGYVRLNFQVGDIRRSLLGIPIWVAQVDLDSVATSLDIYDERRSVATSYNRVFEFESPAFIENRGLAVRGLPDFFDHWNIDLEVSSVPLSRSNTIQTATSDNATTTTVGASVTSIVVLSANSSRKTATFQSASGSGLLHLKFGASASLTDYTVLLSSGDFYELPISYTGVVSGIWSSASGSVLVTEFV